MKKCNKCIDKLDDFIIEEIEKEEMEKQKLAAKSVSPFVPVVEYININWDIKEIKEAGLKVLLVKFKRKVSDSEEKKEIKEKSKYFIVFLAFDKEGNKKELEIEIKYEDSVEASLAKEIEETAEKNIISFKINGNEYETEWKISKDDMPYPFMICHKEKIEEEKIVEEFIENKEFYKKFYSAIKDEKLIEFLKDLFLRLKMRIDDIEKLKGINEVLGCLK